MSEFWLFFRLGLEHILDWNAFHHILFLIVLVAGYSFLNWTKVILLVTVFTLGHSLALLLAIYEIVIVSNRWVDFLIAITILVLAVYNISTAKKKENQRNINFLYFITAFFGIIHGLGFSEHFLRLTSPDSRLLPLIEFALGIEVGQIIVAVVVMIFGFIFQNILHISRRDWILVLSAIVVGVILPVLRENFLAL